MSAAKNDHGGRTGIALDRRSFLRACAALAGAATLPRCLSLDSFLFTGVPVDHYDLPYGADFPADKRVPEDLRAEVSFAAADGTVVYGVFARRPGAESATAPTVVYHHGQNDNIDHFWERASRIWSVGANVLIYDYRGYGKTQGDPTEEGIYQDARAAVGFVRSLGAAVDQTRLFHYGYSMGSGPATQMASEARGPRGLVLESPFTSVDAIVADGSLVVPPSAVISASFDNLSKIRAAAKNCPDGVLLFHGTSDTYVQTRYGAELVAKVREAPAAGKVYPEAVPNADHGDVPTFGDANGNQYSDNLRAFLTDGMPVPAEFPDAES